MFKGGYVWLQALNLQLLFSIRPSNSILAIRDLLQNSRRTNPPTVQFTSRARPVADLLPHTFPRLEHPCRVSRIESCSQFSIQFHSIQFNCMHLCDLGTNIIPLGLTASKKIAVHP